MMMTKKKTMMTIVKGIAMAAAAKNMVLEEMAMLDTPNLKTSMTVIVESRKVIVPKPVALMVLGVLRSPASRSRNQVILDHLTSRSTASLQCLRMVLRPRVDFILR
jgi:hypothetical protein